MRAGTQSAGLALLLGLGAIDLAALNLWVLPSLLLPVVVASRGDTQTAVMAASEREPAAPAAAMAAAAPPATVEAATPPATASAAAQLHAPAPVDAVPSTSTSTSTAEVPAIARGQTPTRVTADRGAQSAVVMFRKGTWWIGPSDRQRLTQLAGTAVDARVRFEIDGYADESGPDLLNHRLSHARADAIAELLVGAGVDRARIGLRAHGELPVLRGDGSNERRAELRVLREEAR
jgi:outer membrane protein OmpA-like peptidoglycan-associated protein